MPFSAHREADGAFSSFPRRLLSRRSVLLRYRSLEPRFGERKNGENKLKTFLYLSPPPFSCGSVVFVCFIIISPQKAFALKFMELNGAYLIASGSKKKTPTEKQLRPVVVLSDTFKK